ncbi:MAG: hypothetical protein IJU44_07775 [Kiritimatiellae bacterium]|nr:hypothetical protein [Kiritimatiellia bacterium]
MSAGCYACQKTGKCAIKDDVKKIICKMMARNGKKMKRFELLEEAK